MSELHISRRNHGGYQAGVFTKVGPASSQSDLGEGGGFAMSVSRGCLLIEKEPNQWWCVVAYREYDYDFISGQKFGPAPSDDAAFAYAMRRCSNPGSVDTVCFSNVSDYHREILARMDGEA